jgi:nicotinamide mononucleotide transporter
MKNPYRDLSKFESVLLLSSLLSVALSFLISPSNDFLPIVASLIGVNALCFVAKGNVFGQILTVIFSIFYGVISYYSAYYGEMITYLGMTSPIAIIAVVSWLKNPYENSSEVKVHNITRKESVLMFAIAFVTTGLFYLILNLVGTAQLPLSTLSVFTSFLAAYLTFKRSPYYALAYMANDLVLILLWIISASTNSSTLPMVICFVVFFANDFYGYINWQRMKRRQLPNSHFEHYSESER